MYDFQNYLLKLQAQFIILIDILIYLGKYNEIKKNIETSRFTNKIKPINDPLISSLESLCVRHISRPFNLHLDF